MDSKKRKEKELKHHAESRRRHPDYPGAVQYFNDREEPCLRAAVGRGHKSIPHREGVEDP